MSDPLEPLLKQLGLTLTGRPDLANGRQPYPGAAPVAFVERDGVPLVLKLLNRGSDEYRSAGILAHWRGEGAAQLIEADEGWVLVERAIPGDDLTGLVASGRDDEATLALCEVMEKLNRPPPRGRPRTVADWGRGFRRNRRAALALGMPAALIDQAEALFFELCRTQSRPILLHGDLQHYNVLRDARRGWLAIDPKGVLGEPAYEPGALLRNPLTDFCADARVIERRARLIAERLGYSYERLIGWGFSQWVLSVLWGIEDRLPYAPEWLAGPLAAQSLL